MGLLPGVNHLKAVRALERAGYDIVRQSKHIIMSDGARTLVVPRNNPLKANTMGATVSAAGPTIDQFRKLL